MREKPNDFIMSVKLPKEVHREFKQIAQQERRAINNLLRIVIEDWLKERQQRQQVQSSGG